MQRWRKKISMKSTAGTKIKEVKRLKKEKKKLNKILVHDKVGFEDNLVLTRSEELTPLESSSYELDELGNLELISFNNF